MKKRILAFLMALCLVAALLPAQVVNAEGTETTTAIKFAEGEAYSCTVLDEDELQFHVVSVEEGGAFGAINFSLAEGSDNCILFTDEGENLAEGTVMVFVMGAGTATLIATEEGNPSNTASITITISGVQQEPDLEDVDAVVLKTGMNSLTIPANGTVTCAYAPYLDGSSATYLFYVEDGQKNWSAAAINDGHATFYEYEFDASDAYGYAVYTHAYESTKIFTVTNHSDVEITLPLQVAKQMNSFEEPVYVAQVGDTKFETLQEALEAAQAGDTLTVLEDVTLTEDMSIDKDIKVVGTYKVALAENVKLSVSAGTYDADITPFCATGYNADANDDGTYTVRAKVALPEVEVINITNPDLTFALNFAIKDMENLTDDYLEKLMADWGEYYTDYVLTISGLSEESVTFNALTSDDENGSDGYLGGQYDNAGENWYYVPFKDVTVKNGESLYIMETAASLLGQSGLRFKLWEVAEIVVNFDCGVFFDEEFLEANPDMEVTLELKVFTEDAEGKKIEDVTVAINKFHIHDLEEVPAKEADCTIDGNIKHLACQFPGCGKLFDAADPTKELKEEDVVIPAAHKTTFVKAKDATCTEDGNKEHWHCSACEQDFVNKAGDALAEDVVIKAAHKTAFVKTKDATCTEDGKKEHWHCDVCKKDFADEAGKVLAKDLVIKAAHKLSHYEAKEATYTSDGNIEYWNCPACKKNFSDAEGKKEITSSVILPKLIKVTEEKAEVSEGAVDKAIEEAVKDDSKDVVLDLTKKDVVGEQAPAVTKTEIPAAAIEKVVEAEASLTLTKEDATVTMDTKALETVANIVKGTEGATTVTLVVEEVETKDLNDKQQAAIETVAQDKKVAMVLSAELLVQTAEGEKKIATEDDKGFQGGTVTVKIPFTLDAGCTIEDYTVIYVADNGATAEINPTYADGCLVIVLSHFSDYVIVNTAAEEETDPTEPSTPSETTKPTEPSTPADTTKPTTPPNVPHTGDNSSVTLMMLLMLASGALVVALCLGLRKKKA